MLTYEENVKPYKNVCNAKEMSTDFCSTDNFLCQTLGPALTLCAPFPVSFCSERQTICTTVFTCCELYSSVFLSIIKPKV